MYRDTVLKRTLLGSLLLGHRGHSHKIKWLKYLSVVKSKGPLSFRQFVIDQNALMQCCNS